MVFIGILPAHFYLANSGPQPEIPLLGMIFGHVEGILLNIYDAQDRCMCAVISVLSNSLQPYGLRLAKLLCPCDSPSKNTGVSCHALLQGIFLTRDQTHISYVSCIDRWVLYH